MASIKLKYKILECRLTVADVARAIDVNIATLYRKLNTPGCFTIKEVLTIKDLLRMTDGEACDIFLN